MRYSEAKEIGEECGLTQPHEFINNIVMHAGSLFVYADIAAELAGLLETAKAAGVMLEEAE